VSSHKINYLIVNEKAVTTRRKINPPDPRPARQFPQSRIYLQNIRNSQKPRHALQRDPGNPKITQGTTPPILPQIAQKPQKWPPTTPKASPFPFKTIGSFAQNSNISPYFKGGIVGQFRRTTTPSATIQLRLSNFVIDFSTRYQPSFYAKLQ
jgi:hypothetical protein